MAFKDDTELQTLNVRIQSGGERAVATMVFMLALQSETRCPFRLIDEINQVCRNFSILSLGKLNEECYMLRAGNGC